MHTEPKYVFLSRAEDKNKDYHIDNYLLIHPGGEQTTLERQVPKRVGKTAKAIRRTEHKSD